MILTDTHCHLNFYDFDVDRATVIDRALRSGLDKILVPGIDIETSNHAIQIAESYQSIYAAVGVHPNSANKWDKRTIGFLDEMTGNQNVVAVGEIGLDYYRDWTPKDLQKRIFKEQLSLAEHLNLPVVIHTRNSNQNDLNCIRDALEILSSISINGVLHSFSGNLFEAEQVLKLGFFLGITGPVTFKGAMDLQKVVAAAPLDRLLIETDSPYLTPVPYRGKRNEPAFVLSVAEKIGEIHNKPTKDIAEITSTNADRLFQWSS